MSARRHPKSRAAEILKYLETHARKSTHDIAAAINWTTTRVSAALWAEMNREPCMIYREETPPAGGRKKPTYLYTHKNYMLPAETTKPEMAAYLDAKLEERKPRSTDAQTDYTPIKDRAIFVDELATPPEPAGTLTDFADALAKAIAQHVVSRVRQHLETQLQAILPPPAANPLPISIEQLAQRIAGNAPVADVAKKQTVLIAGLLPNQAGIIDREFGDVFDLRYYMIGQSMKQLAAMASTVDHVFTFTSKVSHAVEEIMVGKGHKIHRCSGGMTMLKDQLLKLYMGEL
jgi:hypothetical protein